MAANSIPALLDGDRQLSPDEPSMAVMNDAFPDWLFLAPRQDSDRAERDTIVRYWAMRLAWGPCWVARPRPVAHVSRRRRRVA